MHVVPIVHQLCTDTSCLHGGSCGNRGCICAENWWGDRCEKGKCNIAVDIQKCPIWVYSMLVCSMFVYFMLVCSMMVCSILVCSKLMCSMLVYFMLVYSNLIYTIFGLFHVSLSHVGPFHEGMLQIPFWAHIYNVVFIASTYGYIIRNLHFLEHII